MAKALNWFKVRFRVVMVDDLGHSAHEQIKRLIEDLTGGLKTVLLLGVDDAFETYWSTSVSINANRVVKALQKLPQVVRVEVTYQRV